MAGRNRCRDSRQRREPRATARKTRFPDPAGTGRSAWGPSERRRCDPGFRLRRGRFSIHLHLHRHYVQRHRGRYPGRLYPGFRHRTRRRVRGGDAYQLPGRSGQRRLLQESGRRPPAPGACNAGQLSGCHRQRRHPGKNDRLQLDVAFKNHARSGVQHPACCPGNVWRGPGDPGAQVQRPRERRLRHRLADRRGPDPYPARARVFRVFGGERRPRPGCRRQDLLLPRRDDGPRIRP
jgi:hypothetical protein